MGTLGSSSGFFGARSRPYVIAEIGSNHNGDMALCRKMVDAAKEAGADAVKFQSFSSTSLISEAEYKRRTSYGDSPEEKHRHFGSLKEMVETYQFTRENHFEIARYCQSIDIEFISTPFSSEEVDLLEEIGVSFYKIASMDVNHLVLLQTIGSTKKPVILSTGMATLGEIETAIFTLQQAGAGDITLLHCVSIYPPKDADINLNNIPMLEMAFDLPIGFSDHTIGTDVPLVAMSLGACVIEKHFTLDKRLAGWDHWISADPNELALISKFARLSKSELNEQAEMLPKARAYRGSYKRIVSADERKKRSQMRRCIVAKRDLEKDHLIIAADLDFKRPGTGIHPNEMKYVIGRRLRKPVSYDHEFSWKDFL